MNNFGDAIKCTKKGCIRVELQAQEVPNSSQSQGLGHGNGDACIVILTITDTGKDVTKKRTHSIDELTPPIKGFFVVIYLL